jgi:selenocysteine lyase/cysteine desulfurase
MPEFSDPWQRFREQMPITRRLAYLDHAATAPISGPASEVVQAWSRQAAELGATVWPEWEQRANQVRRTAAGLIGAAEEEVALVPNTSAGISLVAEGFPWREGDNVVTLANEFPSNLYPWMNLAGRGVETHDFSRIELNLRPDASRYEGGSRNMVGHLALGASLDLLAGLGLSSERSPVAERVLALTDEAAARLESIGAVVKSCRLPLRRSGILAFELPGRNPVEVRRRCLQAGVVLSVRGGNLRISPHAYNDETDLDRLIAALSGGA